MNSVINNKKILITGVAGFIGFHIARHLTFLGYEVIGLDNINNYYDVNLKYDRLNEMGIIRSTIRNNEHTSSVSFQNFQFIKADITDSDFIMNFMRSEQFNYVIHLAAQAGVRYSLENPSVYTLTNINGFLNILEGCRYSNIQHLIYASSSSVYGLNGLLPFSEKQATDHPVSLYAATKKANEMMAHSYSHLFNFPTTGLRFFTVYGPWGRPDMALYLFAEAIYNDRPINIFNWGRMIRDFTYIDDIVESIYRLLQRPPAPYPDWNNQLLDHSTSSAPYRIFNIGNSVPVELMTYIEELERCLGKTAAKKFMDMQPGDVLATHSDSTALENYIQFKPRTSVEEGVRKFVKWFVDRQAKNLTAL